MAISPGKLQHLKALSNNEGIIAAAAMDQRGSLQKSLASAKGVDQKAITYEMMSEFKVAALEPPALDPAAMELMMFDLKYPKLRGQVRKTLLETQLAVENGTLVPPDSLRVLSCLAKISKLRRGSKRST